MIKLTPQISYLKVSEDRYIHASSPGPPSFSSLLGIKDQNVVTQPETFTDDPPGRSKGTFGLTGMSKSYRILTLQSITQN